MMHQTPGDHFSVAHRTNSGKIVFPQIQLIAYNFPPAVRGRTCDKFPGHSEGEKETYYQNKTDNSYNM